MTAAASIDSRADEAPEAMIGSRVLKVYDADLDVLRFHGKLRDPLTRRPFVIEVTAGSPYTLLDRRRRQTLFTRTAADAGAILDAVLDDEEARSPLRTRVRAGWPSSVNRDRTYEAGKSIQEIPAQLAGVDDGFYFIEQPLDAVAGVYTELELRYPTSGGDLPGVKLEWGDGTIGNLDDFSIVETLPVNGVTATGAGEGDAGRLTSRKTDPTSIATYDLFETEVAHSDVTIQSTLDQHALETLKPQPGKVYTVRPVGSGAHDVGGIYVPRLWRDFDVGDIIRLTIHDGATAEDDVHVRVTEATIEISDAADAEQLTSLTLETV